MVITNIQRTFARYNLIQNIMANNYQPFNRSLLAMATLQPCRYLSSPRIQAKNQTILYIMCDDHAIQAISAYGSAISQLAPTPNIDRLAERGMKFNEAFVENSLSTPSRACLMTGLYSHQNGQRMLAEGIDSTKPSSLKCCRRQAMRRQ